MPTQRKTKNSLNKLTQLFFLVFALIGIVSIFYLAYQKITRPKTVSDFLPANTIAFLELDVTKQYPFDYLSFLTKLSNQDLESVSKTSNLQKLGFAELPNNETVVFYKTTENYNFIPENNQIKLIDQSLSKNSDYIKTFSNLPQKDLSVHGYFTTDFIKSLENSDHEKLFNIASKNINNLGISGKHIDQELSLLSYLNIEKTNLDNQIFYRSKKHNYNLIKYIPENTSIAISGVDLRGKLQALTNLLKAQNSTSEFIFIAGIENVIQDFYPNLNFQTLLDFGALEYLYLQKNENQLIVVELPIEYHSEKFLESIEKKYLKTLQDNTKIQSFELPDGTVGQEIIAQKTNQEFQETESGIIYVSSNDQEFAFLLDGNDLLISDSLSLLEESVSQNQIINIEKYYDEHIFLNNQFKTNIYLKYFDDGIISKTLFSQK